MPVLMETFKSILEDDLMDERTAKNLEMLGLYKGVLTRQQLLTLRGQILHGDHDAAFRGLTRILMGGATNAAK